ALLWHQYFPLNKSLWTSSFVLLTSGIGVLVLLALVRVESWSYSSGIFKALTMMGKNPLFIYAASILFAKTLGLININGISLYQHGFNALNAFLDPYNASLVFAILVVALLWLVAWVLDRKKLVITI